MSLKADLMPMAAWMSPPATRALFALPGRRLAVTP
jgi:hypothetical protein